MFRETVVGLSNDLVASEVGGSTAKFESSAVVWLRPDLSMPADSTLSALPNGAPL
jgi:hypothetical protein